MILSAREFNAVKNKIYCASCEDEIVKFPDNVIDLTITSPPFYDDNLYVLDDGRMEFGWETYDEYLEHIEFMLEQLLRVSKPNAKCVLVLSNSPKINNAGIIISYWPCIHDTISRAIQSGWILQNEAVWIKNKPSYESVTETNKPNVQLNPYHDWVTILRKPAPNDEQITELSSKTKAISLWDLPAEGPDKEYNELYGSFPVEFLRRCIDYWSLPNDLVLDPYAGSGQTIKTAIKMNRHAIGIEADPRWRKLWKNL